MMIGSLFKKVKNALFSSGKIDKLYCALVILLCLYGSAMIVSAGGPYAEARYGDRWYFVKRQFFWLLLGFLAAYFASKISMTLLRSATPALYAVSIVLLILVLLIGFAGNGAKRWLSVGPFTVQPSEILKMTVVLMLAYYYSGNETLALDKKNRKNAFWYGTLIPGLLILFPLVLIMLQKHLSCIIILGALGVSVMFVSGIRTRYLSMASLAGIGGVTYIALFTDYTKERITVWQNPEAYRLTGGWQTLQGLMAIGSGGLFGLGYGKSLLKYCYVSEPANDMIFAILCEELGFFGAAAALLLFALLVLRGYSIAWKAENVFARLTAFGISTKIALQVLLNVAVVTNSIPNTGISLPFFSYGGSSLIMLLFEMGIMLSISKKAAIES